jgi:hypothetical protein
LSDEHFTVDGTLLEACASLKSFKPVGETAGAPPDDPGNPTVNFHGEKRFNDTHESTTDPDAMLARKGAGKEAKLSYSGHVLMENRNGLVTDVKVLPGDGNPRTRRRADDDRIDPRRWARDESQAIKAMTPRSSWRSAAI